MTLGYNALKLLRLYMAISAHDADCATRNNGKCKCGAEEIRTRILLPFLKRLGISEEQAQKEIS